MNQIIVTVDLVKEKVKCNRAKLTSQPAFSCSKLTIKTLEQEVKYVQS